MKPTQSTRVTAIIRNGMKNQPEQRWPAFDGTFQDRNDFITASQAAWCELRLYFDKNQDKYPPRRGNDPAGIFARGHNVEAWVVDQLIASKAGAAFTGIGDQQRTYYNAVQSGTPDGIMQDSTERYLLEFKSIDPRANRSKLPKREHIVQVNQNIELVNDCSYGEGRPAIKSGYLVYFDCSNYTVIDEFEVVYDADLGDEVYAKAEKIMAATSADGLVAEGMQNGGCTYCEYKAHCSANIGRDVADKKLHDAKALLAASTFNKS